MHINNDALAWLILTVVFLGIELMVPAIVSIWFALSAGILALISTFIKNPLNEFYIFVALSGIFLLLTRPFVKKILEKRKPIENRIFGQDVQILKKIGEGVYEVKLDGKYWKAVSESPLEINDIAKVNKIEGNKLVLKNK